MGADGLEDALREVVAESTGDPSVQIKSLVRLSGGASRETWSFDALHGDGTVEPLILRRDPPGALKSVMAKEQEVLGAASAAAVPVPRLVAAGGGSSPIGSAFMIMERIPGETIPRRILRDEAFEAARPKMAAQCGTILARIHAIPLDAVPVLVRGEPLDEMRAALDELGQPHPAFELGLRWLADHQPPLNEPAVVHGDFRNGNLIVDERGVRSVLDWEMARLGDPLEDLAWLCVRAWRFGHDDRRVGGFGDVDDLVRSYEAESGRRVDLDALRWWETLGTLKWGVICIMQAWTHLAGVVRSVELAAIGRRVCENEWDLLNLLPPPWDGRAEAAAPSAPPAEATPWRSTPHDRPTAAELVDAVRAFLDRDVLAATDGRVKFHTRVALNVLGMVERELALGEAHRERHARGLVALGVTDEAELARAIRAGSLDGRLGEVAAFVRATVADKLAVANPAYAS